MKKFALVLIRAVLFDIPRMVLLAVEILFVALVGIVLFGLPGLMLLVSLLVLGIFLRELGRQVRTEGRGQSQAKQEDGK